jgi:hypothetical protein
LTIVSVEYPEIEIADDDVFIALRDMAEVAQHHATDGVEFFRGKITAEVFVESIAMMEYNE